MAVKTHPVVKSEIASGEGKVGNEGQLEQADAQSASEVDAKTFLKGRRAAVEAEDDGVDKCAGGAEKVREVGHPEVDTTSSEESEAVKIVDEATALAPTTTKKRRITKQGKVEAEENVKADGGTEDTLDATTCIERRSCQEDSDMCEGFSTTKRARHAKSTRSISAPKTSWLETLPKPDPPPALPKGASSSRQLNQEDHVALWYAIFINFNDFKPPEGQGINKYNWLERKLGKEADDRHKYGWGEYLRGPFMIFARSLINWLKTGANTSTSLTLPKNKVKDRSGKEECWVDWHIVITTLYENFRPAWADMQKERALGKDGNERLRGASTGMMKKILAAVEG